MRKPNYKHAKLIPDNDIFEGLSLEREIERAETSKQPIEATSPQIFTPKKDGVLPEYDIRTDRFEIAQRAMDKVAGSYRAQREEWIKKLTSETEGNNNPVGEA